MKQQLIYSWYEQYKNGIFRYALSILKDSHGAEDIVHDTFVKALSQGHLPEPENAQAWLYRVARNLCYDRLRKIKYEQLQLQVPVQAENPYEYIELIASLAPKDREIVTLRIVGGLTHQEIGAVLGIHGKAAQKRYERAIATLREKEDSLWNKN